MKIGEKQRRFPVMVAELITYAYGKGFELSFGEAHRSEEQQRIYVKSGRSKTMDSRHRDRLAIDLNLFIDGIYVKDGGPYRMLGEKWEMLGGRWGGRFGVLPEEYGARIGWDANHFECAR